MNEQPVDFAVQSIRHYLVRAPHSADTVSGIHAWWIDWPEPAPPQAITLKALQRLEADGLVERASIGNSELWRRRSDEFSE
jgi:hypothetical protein